MRESMLGSDVAVDIKNNKKGNTLELVFMGYFKFRIWKEYQIIYNEPIKYYRCAGYSMRLVVGIWIMHVLWSVLCLII